MRTCFTGLIAACVLVLSGCGYNTIQTQDEAVTAAWSEVVNQYQRRADLIPNLVNTVKGYAAQEQAVLLGVTEARAKDGSIQATPELVNDPQAFANFQAAQGQLTSALSRLLRTPKWGKYYAWATVIAGDCHYIKRFMPDDLAGKVIVTNTTTPEDVEAFRKAGVKYLVTTTPVMDGRSFGTNMMEAALVAVSGKGRPLTWPELSELIDKLGFEPQLQELN